MTLIKCPECGKEVSDTSKRCVNCGGKILNVEKVRLFFRIIIVSIILISTLTSIIYWYELAKPEEGKILTPRDLIYKELANTYYFLYLGSGTFNLNNFRITSFDKKGENEYRVRTNYSDDWHICTVDEEKEEANCQWENI